MKKSTSLLLLLILLTGLTTALDYNSPSTENLFHGYEKSSCPPNDYSNNGNNGSCGGNIEFDYSGGPNTLDLNEDGLSTSWRFDGDGDYINLTGMNTDDSSMAISTWIKPENVTSARYIATHADSDWSSGAWGKGLVISPASAPEGTIAFHTYDGSSEQDAVIPAENVSKDEWHHVTGTYDASAGETRIYLNGTLMDTVSTSSTQNLPDFAVGYKPQSGSCLSVWVCEGWYKGQIDSLHRFNEAVNDTQAENLYKTDTLDNQTVEAQNFAPKYDNYTQYKQEINLSESNNASVQVKDNDTGIQEVFISSNATGSFKNYTSDFVEKNSNEFFSDQGYGYSPIHGFNGPVAHQLDGNTVVCTQESGDNANDPHVRRFFHENNSWSQAYDAGDNPLTDDAHGGPACIKGPNDYWHVFYGSHSSEILYSRSQNKNSIQSWEQVNNFPGSVTTYPRVRTFNNSIYVFYRSKTQNPTEFSWVRSSDSGNTWSSPQMFTNSSGHRDNYNEFSLNVLEPNNVVGSQHLYWSTEIRGTDVFAGYLNTSDMHMYNMTGYDMGEVASETELKDHAKAVDTGPGVSEDTNAAKGERKRKPRYGFGDYWIAYPDNSTGTLYTAYWNTTSSSWTVKDTGLSFIDEGVTNYDFRVTGEGKLTVILPQESVDGRAEGYETNKYVTTDYGDTWTLEEEILDARNDDTLYGFQGFRFAYNSTPDYYNTFIGENHDSASNNGTKVFAFSSLNKYVSYSDSPTSWVEPVFDFFGFETGTKYFKIWMSDGDKTNSTDIQSYTATGPEDITVPSVSIVSPLNQTYSSSSVDLNVTSSESANYTYNVDGGSNTTVNEDDTDLNTTLSGLSDGGHTVNVWATDSAGNTGSASTSFTVNADVYVQINSSVQINQSANNAYINATDTLNLSSLTLYDDTTDFGGINWSISGNTTDDINIQISHFSDENNVGEFLANYSLSTSINTKVTNTFSSVATDSVYKIYKAGTSFTQADAGSNGIFDYVYTAASTAYQSFSVERTDNFQPEFNKTTYRLNPQKNIEQLRFELWSRGENDFASASGTGTQVTFTNTSLVYNITLPVSDTYNVTDNQSLTATQKIDLSKNSLGISENTSYSHDLSIQERIQELNITNNEAEAVNYNWTSNFSNELTGQVPATTTSTISDSQRQDNIDNKTYSFGPEQGEITLGFNYTGIQPLEINNTVSTSFTDVSTSGGVGSFTRCAQSNTTSIDVSSDETKNYSVGFTCNPGNKGNPVQTVNNVSSDKERVWYNSTDMTIYNNRTENNSIAIKADKSNVKNPDNRDGGSLKAVVEETESTNTDELNISDTGSFFRITVGTGFQNSSLHTDDTDWSVTYTLSGDATVVSGGGGGGSDEDSESQIIYFGDDETSDGLETVDVPFGKEVVRNMTVVNERQSSTKAKVIVGNDPVCEYVTVQKSLTSDQFAKKAQYDLPAATQTLGTVEAVKQFEIKYNLPNQTVLDSQGVKDYTCKFDTSSSYGTAEPLVVDLNPEFNLLSREVCFDVPVDGVSSDLTGEGFDSSTTEFCLTGWQIGFGVLAGFIGLFLLFGRD